jgi:tetratricopeptide (TPR) repeat protein
LEAVRSLNRGPSRLLTEAARLESLGRLEAAADLQLQALQLDPKLTQAHINLISLYGRLGDPVRGEQHYREATALNPNAHEAYYNFGVLCYQSHRRAEARTAFEKALAIDPGYSEAHNNLGALLEEERDLGGAAEHFRKAIESQPSFALAHFHLGRIYANRGQYSEAIQEFQQAVDQPAGESAPTYLYALGAAQARAGHAAAAGKSLTEARQKALSLGQSALAASIDRDLQRLPR